MLDYIRSTMTRKLRRFLFLYAQPWWGHTWSSMFSFSKLLSERCRESGEGSAKCFKDVRKLLTLLHVKSSKEIWYCGNLPSATKQLAW